MQIAIPIYDGFTALDAIGPYDVLQQMPEASVVFCAPEERVYRTESGALGVCADSSFDRVRAPEVVVVPGGLARIAQAGATDFTAVVMGANADELSRTRAVLSSFAG